MIQQFRVKSDLDEISDVLKSCVFYSVMTELELYIQSSFGLEPVHTAEVGELFESEMIDKGSFFTKEGALCGKLSFVKSGYLRVFKYLDGKEVTQWISSQGEFVAELSSLMYGTPSRWNIEALTDCKLYTISQSNYQKIGQIVPHWEALEKQIIAKCFVSLEDRVFSFLSMSAEQRYLKLFDQNKELMNQIPLQYLASMLGMSPETMSRIRKKLSS
ncbi:Crp/Fnr family transcriptional regulator [Reichenbachiella sp. MSK19-1]|uniref:Crp/Fnr family transcriptional regulator n=1 Tax=Reichenbachiella sp. MSK19-1 TaxID=1897631 RepID=UPI002101A2FD|nr:Crp/Fnr family transcriptional regulator [Reichenbachiella sp. MSK19-1]